jgi:hypothetical protein
MLNEHSPGIADRLESSRESHKKFQELVGGIEKLRNSTESIPASFLIVCRRKTAGRLASAGLYPFSPEESVQRYEIGEVDFEKVFDARIDFLTRSINSLSNRSEPDRQDFHAESLNNFRTHVKNGRVEFSMFGNNMRATMQAVQLRHKEFLMFGADDGSHEYRWVESCVKMGWLFPPRVHTYRPIDDKLMPYACSASEGTYDNRLLVSIFSYPYFEYEDNPKIAPDFENCLLGLRVLQAAESSCNLFAAQKIRSRVHVAFLCDLLNDCFSYPSKLVRAVIREFSEFELIETESKQLLESNEPIGEVHITQKGKYVLQYCLSDVAHLAMCAMRIPMSIGVLGLDDNTPPLFRASAYRVKIGGRNDLMQWVLTKAINSINLFKLLVYLDDVQISSMKEKYQEITRSYLGAGTDQNWKLTILREFSSNMKPLSRNRESVHKQVANMLRSIKGTENTAEQFLRALRKNRETWWKA